jgi:eukaryotic-like serine/threonine-protein kinase
MTPDKYRRVKQLFNAALDRNPHERAVFLHEACEGEAELRGAVEHLLAAHHEADDFIEAPAIALTAQSLLEDLPATLQQIGPYRIIREIGRGGMGAVYLADRADHEYQKQVAIKVIRRGLDTEDIIRRFRNERQILARLDHPLIARLLDGGTTTDGLPYFVMEQVEGLSLIEYCDRNRLSIVERLKLFRAVCSAVHYAHQNLVIHRDIKPGNILVTADGTPKLLDFGIAKVFHPDLSAQATVTELQAMTPDYASPEQVLGLPVTTASDLYSLGVLLYQLLTGRQPYRLRTSRPDEIVRAITERQPDKPSTAIRQTSGGHTEKLRRRLKGDLDNIVLMAMRKEPYRRYSSVEQFSEDIRRHLEGLPCIARADTFAYRGAKFVRRNKLAVAAAAVIVLTLVAGIIGTAWQASRVAEQSEIARQQRDKALIEQAKAERINAFLQQMLSYANPSWYAAGRGKRRDLTVIEALDEASQRVEIEMSDQPEVRAEIHTTIGDTYRSIGRSDLAEPHFEAALKIRRELFAEDHVKVAESLFYLGGVKSLLSDRATAETLYRQALAIQRARPAEGNNLPYMMLDLASVLNWKGEMEEAEALLLEALAIFEQRNGAEHVTVAIAHDYLGYTYHEWGDFDRAEKELREALRLYAKTPHTETAKNMYFLSGFEKARGNYKEAESLLRQALDQFRQVNGEIYSLTAGAITSLADLAELKGNNKEAARGYEKSLDIYRQLAAQDSQEPNTYSFAIASILMRTGQYARAETLFRQYLSLPSVIARGRSRGLAEGKKSLGECLMAEKRFAEAEPLLKESLESFRAVQVPHSPRIADAERLLEKLYLSWKKAKAR